MIFSSMFSWTSHKFHGVETEFRCCVDTPVFRHTDWIISDLPAVVK